MWFVSLLIVSFKKYWEHASTCWYLSLIYDSNWDIMIRMASTNGHTVDLFITCVGINFRIFASYGLTIYSAPLQQERPLARGDAIFKETGYQLLSIAELLISTCISMNINFAHQLGNKIDENKYSSNIDDTSLLVFFLGQTQVYKQLKN